MKTLECIYKPTSPTYDTLIEWFSTVCGLSFNMAHRKGMCYLWLIYRGPFGTISLHWRHNGRDCVSNHQPHDCLLSRLFRRRSKKTSKLRVTGPCAGNSPGPVNSPHKWPVTRKMFSFDDVIMLCRCYKRKRSHSHLYLLVARCHDTNLPWLYKWYNIKLIPITTKVHIVVGMNKQHNLYIEIFVM